VFVLCACVCDADIIVWAKGLVGGVHTRTGVGVVVLRAYVRTVVREGVEAGRARRAHSSEAQRSMMAWHGAI
jgi:hypothetical protein